MPDTDGIGMAYSVGLELSAKVPEEPPRGTVIVTANGNAFQSQVVMMGSGSRWLRASAVREPHGEVFMCTWLELIALHGPVTIIYLPEDDPIEGTKTK